jgi:benzoate-CoA ligase family protein
LVNIVHYLAYSTTVRLMPMKSDRRSAIDPAEQFNAASYFVDRHLEDGNGERTAFVDESGPHSYFELARRVDGAAAGLKHCGVSSGDRVILCLVDSINFPALFFGALKIGAIPVPINTYLTSADYEAIARDSAPAAVVISAAIGAAWQPIFSGNHSIGNVIVADGSAADVARDTRSLDAVVGESAATIEPVPTRAADVGFWLYSSGSTGKPKGVVHRHADLLHTALNYGEGVLGITGEDRLFSASKMFFAYGLGNACTFPLHAGATSILMPARATPESVVRTMRAHQPTIFFGVPTLFASILAHLENDAEPLSSRLRICASAGEALPAAIADKWRARFGVEILDGLGSTEVLHIFISNRPGAVRHATSGTPVSGYDVAIRSDDGRDAGVDEVGDLWVRGESIAAGYWNAPEATARTFVEGWLRTGDKFSRDADGFYHYAGRGDDMLKVGGIWLSPVEVEAVLLEHPGVLDAAVVGRADADSLIKPRAFIVPRDAADACDEFAAKLKQFVRERLAHYKCPRWIEFRTELPRTSTGKLRRAALRDES